jgi:WD40 repeat protein
MSRFVTSLELPTGAVTGLYLGSHYQSVIALGANKKYFPFGLPGMNEFACYPAGGGIPNGLTVHEEAKLVALPGGDKLVRLLQIDTRRIVTELKGHADFCTDCVWKSRNQLLSAAKARTVKLFDAQQTQSPQSSRSARRHPRTSS